MFPSPSQLSPQRVFSAPAVAAINHLLAQETWARELLARHAGKEARIDTGQLALRVLVAPDGMLEAGQGEGEPAVTLRMKLADLPLIAQDRSRALSYVKIEGDAEFANTLSQLANGLRWDAAHDLERVIGPLAAHRLTEGGRRAQSGLLDAGRRLAQNFAEFLAEERPVLLRSSLRDEFAEGVVRLRDDVERAAKRIAKLEQRLARIDADAAPRIMTDLTSDRR